jgi:hypothetical protein
MEKDLEWVMEWGWLISNSCKCKFNYKKMRKFKIHKKNKRNEIN